MSKYVDADALSDAIRRNVEAYYSAWGSGYDSAEGALSEIENFPAADVAPVIHEHWTKVKFADSVALINKGDSHLIDGFLCGSCGHDAYEKTAYCPHCGAKMDVEEVSG